MKTRYPCFIAICKPKPSFTCICLACKPSRSTSSVPSVSTPSISKINVVTFLNSARTFILCQFANMQISFHVPDDSLAHLQICILIITSGYLSIHRPMHSVSFRDALQYFLLFCLQSLEFAGSIQEDP